ncbi:MAG: CotH kinase family protein [Oscillospiraceae bacterium]|nr:CotH kinase family protein [Oscillospiraceae bacterium]
MKVKKIYSVLCAAVCVCGFAACDKNTSEQAETATAASVHVISSGQTTVTEASTSESETEQTTIETEPLSVYDESCSAKITRFAISADNEYMISPIEYEINQENKTIAVNITYENYADIHTLQNCIVDIEIENGEYAFDMTNPDGTADLTRLTEIVVTDENGTKNKYDVITERTVFDLPIVNVYLENLTDQSNIGRDEYIPMTFFIDNTGADEYGAGTDVLTGKIRGRGHSTWKWEKKPYRIKLDEKTSVLGLGENKDWVLLANYSDKAMLRNITAYSMSRSLDGMDWNPTQYPVDLFVNGIYRGVYTIGEHMEAAESRVNIETGSSEADTGYLLEVGGDDEGDVKGKDYFHTEQKLAKFIKIKSPDTDEMTESQMEFIVDYINKTEEAIVSGIGYEEYIDVDSFCDWIIIHELSYNSDCCFRRSCYLNKDKGGKLKLGPVWDFDLAFGNCNKDNQNYDDWVTVGESYKDAYVQVNWCNYLMENESFRSRLRERWFEVRDALVEEAMSCIDYYGAKLERSQIKNYEAWNVWGKKTGYQSWHNLEFDITYNDQIQYLKDFITKRAEWIDENI